MFAVATAYDSLSPGLFMTKYGECAWESFFRAVSMGLKVSAVYYDTETYCTLRAEYEGGEFKIFDY
jgi:hypothetical protein